MIQEALLRGTKGISRGNIEMDEYKGRWLVRWKDLDGYAHREFFPLDAGDTAHAKFLEVVNTIREQIRTRKACGENLSIGKDAEI